MIKVKMKKPNYDTEEIREKILMNRSSKMSKSVSDELKRNLIENFNNKCAYCETKIGFIAHIDNYRPKSGARNFDGKVSKEHYWWLKFEWDNLLPTCPECSANKSDRFAVFSNRVEVGTFEHKELARELPGLLHPYYDDPEEYLLYTEDGHMYSDNQRALITIETLNLNRINLVNQRREEYIKLHTKWTRLVDYYSRTINENSLENTLLLNELIFKIKSILGDNEEFCGLKRQFVRLWMRATPLLKELLVIRDPFFNSVYNNSPEIIKSENVEKLKYFRDLERIKDNYDIKKSDDRKKYFSKRRHIERVVINNFKTIDNLDIIITLGKSSKYSAPWLMLLGENGTGKSTILHAIALALMDRESRERYVKNASSLLKVGTEEGFISVYLSGSYEPITINFCKNRKDFFGDNISTQRVIMLGYGSTRLLPKRTSRKKDHFGVLRVENLFNPLYLLVNASRQLYQLENDEFQNFIPVLKSLLLLKDISIEKDQKLKNKVIINYNNKYSVSLDELSDGYRSMIALAVDIIMALRYLNWSPDDGEAIVLIDELDAHLHPQWILQIVTRMRKTFPNIQFIVTSHDPLCLRGLEQNEIVVLQKDNEDEVFIERELPPQEFLEVDRLLKSQFFGLNDTQDPEINSDFKEYYRLLGLINRNHDEEDQLKGLKKKLITNDYLGKTPREQMLYGVIDEYMAKTKYSPLKNLVNLKNETKRKLLEIITSVEEGKDTTDDTH
ncbi:chromosome segregation protein SMC [Bacillus toyonensis]|uniref:AAA family ATPase n=1 Tax=Bacillus toyonensis TaxID=155322 RepID=UPI000BF52557|nr:AAA family ATPase [Bacillus toyonensis]PGC09925.1 chromosome segregation protein SMC [Bacillus toyonensis]PGC78827.1 chromosome segregation protein SMC [Bacillus toyonensis]